MTVSATALKCEPQVGRREIYTDVVIDADRETVWQVLTDFGFGSDELVQ